ncbi:MAG: DUF29 domain-containing protein [Candidatus Methylumidiphilus alinenensis]|uniref:DUF29 domain-containing protein n=1 Tax=Candidatus Methylumidiphilus alinenensis TaxID=2202197 RepID=A0A2W4QH43_9GAMM|nr:MAG: DUF29 domain-containing protein [Candidatus Methylumidiphilus alinenensis]
MAGIAYDIDIAAWAQEQSRLLRAGRFDILDIEHIAEEIEDVSKSEQRELASRMAVLLAHLLKWQFQPERRGNSWRRTIIAQRKEIAYHLEEAPSLKAKLTDARWFDMVWSKALAQAASETGLDVFPEVCPWVTDEILGQEFWPG